MPDVENETTETEKTSVPIRLVCAHGFEKDFEMEARELLGANSIQLHGVGFFECTGELRDGRRIYRQRLLK